MTAINYKIKELTSEILGNCSGFYETLGNLRDSPEIPLEESKKILSEINNQKGYIFVALKDNQIIGTSAVLIEKKFLHGGSYVGHIEDVVTRKGYEGKGIGKNLINSCIDAARLQRCYKIILNCRNENVPFYEKLGFHKKHNEMRMDL